MSTDPNQAYYNQVTADAHTIANGAWEYLMPDLFQQTQPDLYHKDAKQFIYEGVEVALLNLPNYDLKEIMADALPALSESIPPHEPQTPHGLAVFTAIVVSTLRKS